MCGICGIYDSQIKHIPRAQVMNMCDVMAHRGPDDFGYWSDEGVVLGHRRLSIIDLKTGAQPMTNEDESVALVANGEIYNYRELQEVLIKKGHRFKSISDSEVIVHAYEEYGDECVAHLRGMFAFALWDKKQGRLFCARDRMGQKPFFYAHREVKGNVQCAFASELTALCAGFPVEKRIDDEALFQYLTYGYVLHPKTIYQGVSKLPPAHTLVVDANGMTVRRYWSREETAISIPSTERQIICELRALLTEATRMRMVSDVPLGAFLSGGLDSSIVVALMSRASSKPVKTFSVGFKDQRYNELSYAQMVANRYKTEHTEFMVEPHMITVIPELVRNVGEPFADSSCLPTYFVAKQTRQHVTVALNGDGADESFAGYERYYAACLSEYIAAMIKRFPQSWMRMLCDKIPARDDQRSFLFRARRFLEGLQLPREQRYRHWVSCLTGAEVSKLYAGNPADDIASSLFADVSGMDVVQQLLYVDQESYLPGDLLVKIDSATMANSLEARSPFLDHKVVEYAWALESRMKLRGKTGKYILRKAFARELPKPVLTRKKMGFGVPVGQWFRNELKDELRDRLCSRSGFVGNYFDRDHIRSMIDTHVDGTWNHDKALWSLYMLEQWYEQCFK